MDGPGAGQLVAKLPVRGLAALPEDEDTIPSQPVWIKFTAILLLLIALLTGIVSSFL